MKLQGLQAKQLRDALLDAFPTSSKLEQMVKFNLNKNLYAIAGGNDLQDVIFGLIRTAESENWIPQLVMGARAANSGNYALFNFAQELGFTISGVPNTVSKLEEFIDKSNSFLDANIWITKLTELESQICRVEINGSPKGTGFLVGPDIIMTNYHVVRKVIDESYDTSAKASVKFRFDYKKYGNNTNRAISTGTTYELVNNTNWLVDHSPATLSELDQREDYTLPKLDQLDYAILKVAGSPGEQPVNFPSMQLPSPIALKRGWIKIPSQEYNFVPNSPLFILQHPEGGVIKLALETQSVIETNQNTTRVFHRTNTIEGSSGSPCFNATWELVALHQGGDLDPNRGQDTLPRYNQAIPIATILKLLEKRGLLSQLNF